MTSVTFPPALGGDGSTVSDDSSPTTGLANGGHRTRFVPALAQTVAMANTAQLAAAAANNAPGTNGTSITSLALGSGAKSLTMQTGRSIVVGMQIIIANTASPATQYMRGVCTGYDSGTGVLDVLVDYVVGTGTVATWTISLTGVLFDTRTTNVVVTGTTQTAVKDSHYILTNVAATTVTLPASPAANDKVWITVANGLMTNGVARNAQTIMGLAEDLTLDQEFAKVALQFVNGSWRIVE